MEMVSIAARGTRLKPYKSCDSLHWAGRFQNDVKSSIVVILAILAMPVGSATPPREVLSAPARTIVVTGFEPFVRGLNVGTTAFQNRSWEATPADFDANDVASRFIAKALVEPVPVIDGRTAGLAFERADRFLFNDVGTQEVVRRLADLGRSKNVDRIVLLATGVAQDWIAGTNLPLKGLGLYRREAFGMKRIQVYGVIQLQVFDCHTEKVVAAETSKAAQQVYAVEWRNNWTEFPAGEQRRVIAAYSHLLRENIAQLLTRAGLANAPLRPERSVAKKLLMIPDRPKSWVPEGDTLPIPPGVSPRRARQAVVNGLTARGWTVISQSDEEVTGSHAADKKEVRVTAVLTASEIKLVPGDREIKPDGSSVPIAPHTRWHNNVKESIYRDLLEAEGTEPEKVSAP